MVCHINAVRGDMDKTYDIEANTIESAVRSEACWFLSGTKFIVIDNNENSEIWIKGYQKNDITGNVNLRRIM